MVLHQSALFGRLQLSQSLLLLLQLERRIGRSDRWLQEKVKGGNILTFHERNEGFKFIGKGKIMGEYKKG